MNYDREHNGALLGKHTVAVRMRPTSAAEQEAIMMGKEVPLSKDLAEFFEKYSADKTTKEVVIERGTKEVRLDLN